MNIRSIPTNLQHLNYQILVISKLKVDVIGFSENKTRYRYNPLNTNSYRAFQNAETEVEVVSPCTFQAVTPRRLFMECVSEKLSLDVSVGILIEGEREICHIFFK